MSCALRVAACCTLHKALLKMCCSAGEAASLKLEYNDERFLTFSDFPSTENGDVDSALALFEHLSDAA